MRDHDRYREDLAPYALGALTELEHSALERHVMGCEECARELEGLRRTVDLLPAAVPAHAASPELRASLMATVRAEADAARVAEASPATAPVRAEPRRSWRDRLRIAVPRPALALAAAAAVAVASVGGYSALDDEPAQVAPTSVAASVDRARLPAAQASLDATGDVGVLRVDGMPNLTGELRYVVWVDRGDGPEYATSFNVRPDGSGTAGVPDVDGVRRVMVTRERTTAVDAPTEQPVLTVALG
jgi:anti-sigma factor RsiW